MRTLIILTSVVPAFASAMIPYQPQRGLQFIDEISNITPWYDVTQARNAAATVQHSKGWRFIDDTKSMTHYYADAACSDDESVNVKKRKRSFGELNFKRSLTSNQIGKESVGEWSYDDIDDLYIKTNENNKKTFVFDEDSELQKIDRLYKDITEHNQSDIYCDCYAQVRLNKSNLESHYSSQNHQQYLTTSIHARKNPTSLEDYRKLIEQNIDNKRKDLYFHCACNKIVHITDKSTLRKHFKTKKHSATIQKIKQKLITKGIIE